MVKIILFIENLYIENNYLFYYNRFITIMISEKHGNRNEKQNFTSTKFLLQCFPLYVVSVVLSLHLDRT